MVKEKLSIIGNKLLDLIGQSVIVQGVLTLGVVGTWGYLMVAGKPIPPELNQIVGLVVGFYFGGKAVLQAQSLKRGG
jgi:hypothetical protein